MVKYGRVAERNSLRFILPAVFSHTGTVLVLVPCDIALAMEMTVISRQSVNCLVYYIYYIIHNFNSLSIAIVEPREETVVANAPTNVAQQPREGIRSIAVKGHCPCTLCFER